MTKAGTALLWLLGTVLGLAALYIIILTVSALLVDRRREYDKDSRYYRFLLNSVTAAAVWLLGIHVSAKGLEKLPEDGRFLLVGNHRSNFDPILTWHVMKKRQLAFISKPENFKIPIFGRIIQRCCFMPIDRENPRNAVKTIDRAAGLLRADEVSVAVYPEGTRSKACVLLPFHNGAFKIAKKAGVPIAAVAIQGTESIHKNGFRRRSEVQLAIADVIPAELVKESRTDVIGERVRKALTDALNETEGEQK